MRLIRNARAAAALLVWCFCAGLIPAAGAGCSSQNRRASVQEERRDATDLSNGGGGEFFDAAGELHVSAESPEGNAEETRDAQDAKKSEGGTIDGRSRSERD